MGAGRKRRKRHAKAIPGGFAAGKPDSQPCRVCREVTHQNAGTTKMMEKVVGNGAADQAKQRRPPDDFDADAGERLVEAARLSVKAFAHRFGPGGIRQRRLADRYGGAGNRPWPESGGQSLCNFRRRQRKAEP